MLVGPLPTLEVRADKHQVQPQLVGVVVVGAHGIPLRLRHLGPVLPDDALVNHLPERLLLRDDAHVEQHHVDEPGVDQVHAGVLGPADIQVDGLVAAFWQELGVAVGQIAQVVERRVHEPVQGIVSPSIGIGQPHVR